MIKVHRGKRRDGQAKPQNFGAAHVSAMLLHFDNQRPCEADTRRPSSYLMRAALCGAGRSVVSGRDGRCSATADIRRGRGRVSIRLDGPFRRCSSGTSEGRGVARTVIVGGRTCRRAGTHRAMSGTTKASIGNRDPESMQMSALLLTCVELHRGDEGHTRAGRAAINVVMLRGGGRRGRAAGSASLQADALDFLAMPERAISLFVVGNGASYRAVTAFQKGQRWLRVRPLGPAVTVWHVWHGTVPTPSRWARLASWRHWRTRPASGRYALDREVTQHG